MELPSDWGAFLDQARKGMSDQATLVASYYMGLRAAGLEPEAALALAINFQSSILMLAMQIQSQAGNPPGGMQ